MYTFDTVDSFQITEPGDTYIYDIVPVAGSLATISSDDTLRFLDPQSLNGAPKHFVPKINTDVTCLKALPSNTAGGELVCTAGRDGRISIVDSRTGTKIGEVRTGKFRAIFIPIRI
jgi:SEL1 protein